MNSIRIPCFHLLLFSLVVSTFTSCLQSSPPQSNHCKTKMGLKFPTDYSVLPESVFYIDKIKFIITEDQGLISSTFPSQAISLTNDLQFYFPASEIIFDKKKDKTFRVKQNHISLARALTSILKNIEINEKPVYNIKYSGELTFNGIIRMTRTDEAPICIESPSFSFLYLN